MADGEPTRRLTTIGADGVAGYIANANRETDAANIELVKMENQAFALVRARRLDETRSIL